MNNKYSNAWFIVPIIIIIALDFYIFQAIRILFIDSKTSTQRIVNFIFWFLSSITYLAFFILIFKGYYNWHGWSKILLVGLAQTIFFGKLLMLPFLVLEDIVRLLGYGIQFLKPSITQAPQTGLSRLQFLSKLGLTVGSFMSVSLIYGIVRGAYNYQIKKIKLKIPKLPDVWKALKIVQFSDMHLGSFADEKPVQKIVDLINEQDADIVLFTGDLVNYEASEIKPYISILKNIKTKTKVYSILGNHDYGTYKQWNSTQEMSSNFNQLIDIQRNELGWDLLMDEHRILEKNGTTLAIIGVQYIGHSMRFGKYGHLRNAYNGAENAAVQLLLSHDPSHWDYEVSQQSIFKNIHATFAGHTHGFQFGIEIPGIKWSPSKYVYPHWAGLYASQQQQLYVNRGIGFLGYPGRLGISPEISVFHLEKA